MSHRTGALGSLASVPVPRPDSSVVERGPEKAGVGGSIPSLATTLSITYDLPKHQSRSNRAAGVG